MRYKHFYKTPFSGEGEYFHNTKIDFVPIIVYKFEYFKVYFENVLKKIGWIEIAVQATF